MVGSEGVGRPWTPSWSLRQASEAANVVTIVSIMGSPLTECLILVTFADIIRGRKMILVGEMKTCHIFYVLRELYLIITSKILLCIYVIGADLAI